MLRERFFQCPAAINTPTSINIFHDSRSHFDPGPPSNVNTVLNNGAAPLKAARRLHGGCGRARERETARTLMHTDRSDVATGAKLCC